MSFLDNLNQDPNRPKQKSPIAPVTDSRPMDEIFMTMLPDSLYWNHYELHERYPHHTANDWRRYLRDMDRFISQEVAAITEANARKALNKLGVGDFKQGDIAAINQLLSRSEQLNKNMKERVQTITTFLPPVAQISPRLGSPKEHVHQQNRRVVYFYYSNDREELQRRLDKGEVIMGDDGILHFPSKAYMTHIDKLYKHFHNPRNLLNGDKVRYDHE